jgi:predicted lactoylglutathione lyase
VEQRISLITLGVGDLVRSRAFYERLGWKRSVRGAEGVAFFQAGGMALALFPRTNLARDAGLHFGDASAAPVALAYNARTKQEVEEVLREAESAGGRIVKPAEIAFYGGYSGYFADLDGFLWEVAWNPSFSLAAVGSLKLPD